MDTSAAVSHMSHMSYTSHEKHLITCKILFLLLLAKHSQEILNFLGRRALRLLAGFFVVRLRSMSERPFYLDVELAGTHRPSAEFMYSFGQFVIGCYYSNTRGIGSVAYRAHDVIIGI